MPRNKGNFIGPIYRYFKDLPKYKYKSDKNIFDNDDNVYNNSKNHQSLKKNIWKDFRQRKIEKIFFEDGRYYIGQVKNGLFDGKGIIYYKDGNIQYDGDFIEGKREGNGKRYHINGSYYIGEYKNGKRHGKGTYFKYNGRIFSEYFENGLLKYKHEIK